MSMGITITKNVHFRQGRGHRKVLALGAEPEPSAQPSGRVPRLARLMALAIRMDGLVRDGEVADYADIARLGHVTRARVSQIMNLLNLAPEIQEALLFLPVTVKGRDPIREHHIRPILTILDWRKQRRLWASVLPRSHKEPTDNGNRYTSPTDRGARFSRMP